MTTRTTHQTVTFARPFLLSGIDGVQPAGAYTIETDEERLQALSFPAYRRLETRLRLRSAAFEQVVRIEPGDLDTALARDAAEESDAAVGATLDDVKTGGVLRPSVRGAAPASSELKDRSGMSVPASVGEPVLTPAPQVIAPTFQPRCGAVGSRGETKTETKTSRLPAGLGRRAPRAIDGWRAFNIAELKLIAVLLGGMGVLGVLMSYDLPLFRGASGP